MNTCKIALATALLAGLSAAPLSAGGRHCAGPQSGPYAAPSYYAAPPATYYAPQTYSYVPQTYGYSYAYAPQTYSYALPVTAPAASYFAQPLSVAPPAQYVAPQAAAQAQAQTCAGASSATAQGFLDSQIGQLLITRLLDRFLQPPQAPPVQDHNVARRLDSLEARVARIERHLNIGIGPNNNGAGPDDSPLNNNPGPSGRGGQ